MRKFAIANRSDNRQSSASGGDQWGANLRYATYNANALNQYINRTVPDFVNILGEATNAATVTVNNQPTYRKDEYYRAELSVDNGDDPVWLSVTNLAVLNNGTNADIINSITGNVFVADTPEAFYYDAVLSLSIPGALSVMTAAVPAMSPESLVLSDCLAKSHTPICAAARQIRNAP